jgi:hypothetical protein
MKIEIEITDAQYEAIKIVAANRSKGGTAITAEELVAKRCAEVVGNIAGRAPAPTTAAA